MDPDSAVVACWAGLIVTAVVAVVVALAGHYVAALAVAGGALGWCAALMTAEQWREGA